MTMSSQDSTALLNKLKEHILFNNAKEAKLLVKKLKPGYLYHYRLPNNGGSSDSKVGSDGSPNSNSSPSGHDADSTRSNDDDDSAADINLLQLAATYMDDLLPARQMLEELIERCPKLLKVQRIRSYEGQTALHTLVARGKTETVKAVCEMLTDVAREELLKIQAKGPNFKGTVMMGELPLSIAALTFNQDMVNTLIKYKASIQWRNYLGDIVFHSLIRFSQCYEEREERVIEMMQFLHKKIDEDTKLLQFGDVGIDRRSVWLMENNEGLTPLKLAAKLVQSKIFHYILTMDGVYSSLGDSDGLFDFLHYDITEIDPVAGKKAGSAERRLDESTRVQETNKASPDLNTGQAVKTSHVQKVSVLEIIYKTKPSFRINRMFEILSQFVVKEVVNLKWRKYRRRFVAWGFVHLFFMAFFTAGVAMRSELTFSSGAQWKKNFVLAMSVILFVWAGLLLACEVVMITRFKKELYFYLNRQHSFGPSRIILILFALSVIVDSIWYWSCRLSPNPVYFAIIGLLSGWWFTTFFLRPFKKFSFFSAMLHKVFFGDLIRFAVVLSLLFVAFTAAMYITFMSSPAPPNDFGDLQNTSVTMFRLMLGLTDADVLNEAAEPWLAILIYVVYLLLTYVLTLTSLFALMSNTVTTVAQDKDGQWLLQMLSVVLFMEAYLPDRGRYAVGRRKRWVRFDSVVHQRKEEDRFAIQIYCVKDRNQQKDSLKPGNGSNPNNYLSKPEDTSRQEAFVNNEDRSQQNGNPDLNGLDDQSKITTQETAGRGKTDRNGVKKRRSKWVEEEEAAEEEDTSQSPLFDLLYTFAYQHKYNTHENDVVMLPRKLTRLDSTKSFGGDMLRKNERVKTTKKLRQAALSFAKLPNEVDQPNWSNTADQPNCSNASGMSTLDVTNLQSLNNTSLS